MMSWRRIPDVPLQEHPKTAPSAFRGLAQVNIPANDVVAARDWYAQALGIEP
ncbi:hypothetical protein ABDK96_10530 [Citricoccus nitrophenolicus]|uniref:VOC family protein n=1 Tax=Citricoccus nitrophenolicus TaxID=863575 RepID=A0ABV0IIX6_9MICC